MIETGRTCPIIEDMNTQNRNAIAALAAAGALWGLTVPLSKLSLTWLAPAWLTIIRFAIAAPILALVGRRGVRAALTLPIAVSGAIGYGAVIVLQNAGLAHTSVSHAAVLVGAVPVIVALITTGRGQATPRPITWVGYAVALAGIALVAGSGGSGATSRGDLLVLASAVLSAGLIVVQPRLLAGRDPAAVTAVQFTAAAVMALPIAGLLEGAPAAPGAPVKAAALAALAVGGTVVPFWLFAFGQSRVPAELAGAYINLEPVVGAAVGWLAFGNSAALAQVAGAAVVLLGIALSTAPPRRPARASRPCPAEGRTRMPWALASVRRPRRDGSRALHEPAHNRVDPVRPALSARAPTVPYQLR
jgi:drug/metabolite transporter (DMT)-like permease